MRNVKVMISVVILALFIASSCEKPKDEQKPKADFNYSPKNPKVNQQIEFMSTSENAVSYAWNFGDDKTSTEQNPTHIFETEGSYNVTLKVTSDLGETASTTKTIVVTIDVGAEVKHSKDITANETWSSKQVHVVTKYIEIKNATLTIEAGTVVKFNEGAGLQFGYSESQISKLIAKGTADKRITLTSSNKAPKAGDWYCIYFGKHATSESIMEYCDISYGGDLNSSPTGSVVVADNNIMFNYNTVMNSSTNGIYCNRKGYFSSFVGNKVSNCEQNAIYIHANYVHTLGVEKGERSVIDNNSLHGIYVDTYNGIYDKGNFTWQNLGARYTLNSGSNSGCEVGSTQGTYLTIEAGCTIAFMDGSEFNIGTDDNKTGALIAKGTADAKIIFKAETIGNSGGSWDCLRFGDYNSDKSILDYCVIESAGGYNSDDAAAIYLGNTTITCTNTIIKDSKGFGIYGKYDGKFKEFSGNTITNSAKSSMYISTQWAHTIGTNNKIDNDGYGIGLHHGFSHKNKTFHWLKQSCPYTLVYGGSGMAFYMGSTEGCTLVIDPGNRIQLGQDATLAMGAQDDKTFTLIAKGTAKERITFAPATETGTWASLFFSKGTAQNAILENCDIISGGGNNGEDYGAIVTNVSLNNTPTIRNCLIKGSKSSGIYIYNGSENGAPVIENCTYQDNKGPNIKYYH